MNYVQASPIPSQPEQRPAHAQTDRQRANRLTQKFVSQMTPWAPGHASVPFEVVIDTLSDTTAGVIHDRPLEVGLRHLLSVPRTSDNKAITLEFVVVRCDHRGEAGYLITLDRAIAPEAVVLPKRRVVSERTKLLLLLFGIFGLLIAAFAPLG